MSTNIEKTVEERTARLIQLGPGNRFPLSAFDCPECGEKALEDHWPPNYGGASGCLGIGEDSYMESNYSMKCVCPECMIAFRVFVHSKTKWDPQTYSTVQVEKEVTYSETVPLEERDGKLLTPHDVQREEYREEHGEYPMEVYG